MDDKKDGSIVVTFSIEQLTTFVAVFETKSFSKAATLLGKHRTTTSQVIGNLEDDLAVPLFERVGRSVESTDAGKMLYHYAKLVVEQASALNKVAMSLSVGQLQELTIAYTSFIPNNVLVAVRDALSEQFPLLKVNFLIRAREEIREGIENGEFHIGFVNVDVRRVITNMDATFLRNIRFSIYGSKYGELAKTPPDLLFGKLKTTRQFVLKSLIKDDMAHKIILSANYDQVDSLALMIKFIKEDLGWGILPRVSVNESLVDGLMELKFDEFKDDIVVPVAMWCTYSDEITEIKQTIQTAITEFVEMTNK